MIFTVFFINGKVTGFDADFVEEEDGTYKFYLDGELVAEFLKQNIAGYVMMNVDDLEEDEF